jgi:hypothetical protein
MSKQHERPTPMAVDSAPVPEAQAGAVTPSEWHKGLTDSVPIECPAWEVNGLMGHNTPRKDWSIYSEDDNEVRYELRAGETYQGTWPDTPPTERCEMGQHHRYDVRGNTFTVDYEWLVEGGPAISWSDDQPIERDHWYKMRLQQQQGTPGKVRLWRDGELVCEYDGNVGYTDQTQTYWKQGIYRKRPDRGETLAMRYRNVKITEGLPVPSAPDHGGSGGGGGSPTPEPGTKTVNVHIEVPDGVEVEVWINDERAG